jgi:hypothetical protein
MRFLTAFLFHLEVVAELFHYVSMESELMGRPIVTLTMGTLSGRGPVFINFVSPRPLRRVVRYGKGRDDPGGRPWSHRFQWVLAMRFSMFASAVALSPVLIFVTCSAFAGQVSAQGGCSLSRLRSFTHRSHFCIFPSLAN